MQPDLRPEQLESREALLLIPDQVMLRDGPVRDHALLIAGSKFRDVGPAADVVKRNPELRAIRLEGKLVMPGFIDAHHHLTQSFGKALAFGEPSEISRHSGAGSPPWSMPEHAPRAMWVQLLRP
jgi:5-methylthioadenosine/S-adenosylhomocysteine deaminase